jgi:hypothetical protein
LTLSFFTSNGQPFKHNNTIQLQIDERVDEMIAESGVLLLRVNQSAKKSPPSAADSRAQSSTLQHPSSAGVHGSWSVACSHMNTGLAHPMWHAVC